MLKIQDFPPARSVWAEALARLGLGDPGKEAQRAFDGSSQFPPEERLQIKARLLRIRGESDAAIQAYQQLLAGYPGSSRHLEYGFGLVESRIGAEQGREALRDLKSLQSEAKENPRFHLWESWAANAVQDYQLQREAATKAIAAVEGKKGYRLFEAKARLFRGIAQARSNDLEEAIPDFDKARQYYAQAYDRRGEAQALDALAQALFDQGKLASAERTRRRLIAVYQDLQNPRGLASQHLRLAQVLSEQGKLAEAQRTGELAVREFGAIEDDSGKAQALGDLGLFLQRQGKLAEAVQRCRQAITLAQDLEGGEEQARQLYANLAQVRLQGMELKWAEDSFEQFQQMAEAAKAPQEIALAYMGLGDVAIAQGNLEKAEKSYQEALDQRRRLKTDRTVAESRLKLAAVLLEKLRPEDAADQLEEALTLFRGERMRDQEAQAEALLARALLAQDRPADAKSAIEKARELAGPSERPDLHIEVSLAEARVRDRLGERDAAIQILQEALVRAQQAGLASQALEARLILGGIEARQGDRSRLQGVEQEARIRGFLLIAGKARRLLDGRAPAPV